MFTLHEAQIPHAFLLDEFPRLQKNHIYVHATHPNGDGGFKILLGGTGPLSILRASEDSLSHRHCKRKEKIATIGRHINLTYRDAIVHITYNATPLSALVVGAPHMHSGQRRCCLPKSKKISPFLVRLGGEHNYVPTSPQSILGRVEPTCILVPWRQGFRHPTRNECMGCFNQIIHTRWPLAQSPLIRAHNTLPTNSPTLETRFLTCHPIKMLAFTRVGTTPILTVGVFHSFFFKNPII